MLYQVQVIQYIHTYSTGIQAGYQYPHYIVSHLYCTIFIPMGFQIYFRYRLFRQVMILVFLTYNDLITATYSCGTGAVSLIAFTVCSFNCLHYRISVVGTIVATKQEAQRHLLIPAPFVTEPATLIDPRKIPVDSSKQPIG